MCVLTAVLERVGCTFRCQSSVFSALSCSAVFGVHKPRFVNERERNVHENPMFMNTLFTGPIFVNEHKRNIHENMNVHERVHERGKKSK